MWGIIMNDLKITANEINRLHQLASSTAQQAITYAKEVGRLLLEIKKDLPHGKFTPWLENNVEVSIRQAQRYMEVASGNKIKLQELTSKHDIVSCLSNDEVIKKIRHPTWIPKLGCWHIAIIELGVIHIVPYSNDHDFFHISKFYHLEHVKEDEEFKSYYSGSSRPIHHLSVDGCLHYYGIAYPDKLDWEVGESEGFIKPFGEPESLTNEMKWG